jgi:hypothetical protein
MPTPSDIATEVPPQQASPPNLLTLISIAAFASALVGIIRQMVGQAIATRVLSADWISASPIFAQVNTPTRLAGACGTLATLVLGGIAALVIRADNRLTRGWYFLWVFGCVSLMNSGRLLYSAITDTGDWSVVIESFHPPWLWRVLIAFAGVIIYRPALRFAVGSLRALVLRGEVAYRELWSLILATYVTASSVLTAGALLDPINPGAVKLAVAAASFGLNCGLFVIPAFISAPVEPGCTTTRPISFSWIWLVLGASASIAFFAGVGRAVRF